jgi:hypothetical protein
MCPHTWQEGREGGREESHGWAWWHMPVILATQAAKLEGSKFEASQGKKKFLYAPISKNKMGWTLVTHACDPI